MSKLYILTTRSCRHFFVWLPRMQSHVRGTSWKLWVFARDFVCACLKSGIHTTVCNHAVRVIYLVAVMLLVISLLTIAILSLCRPMRSQRHFGPHLKKASSAWNSAAYESKKNEPLLHYVANLLSSVDLSVSLLPCIKAVVQTYQHHKIMHACPDKCTLINHQFRFWTPSFGKIRSVICFQLYDIGSNTHLLELRWGS